MIIILHKYLYRRHTKEKGLSIHCAGAHTKRFRFVSYTLRIALKAALCAVLCTTPLLSTRMLVKLQCF